MSDPPKVLTLNELAAYLKVHPSTIYRMIKSHRIPSWKMGSDHRFNREQIEAWIQRQESRIGHAEQA